MIDKIVAPATVASGAGDDQVSGSAAVTVTLAEPAIRVPGSRCAVRDVRCDGETVPVIGTGRCAWRIATIQGGYPLEG